MKVYIVIIDGEIKEVYSIKQLAEIYVSNFYVDHVFDNNINHEDFCSNWDIEIVEKEITDFN